MGSVMGTEMGTGMGMGSLWSYPGQHKLRLLLFYVFPPL